MRSASSTNLEERSLEEESQCGAGNEEPQRGARETAENGLEEENGVSRDEVVRSPSVATTRDYQSLEAIGGEDRAPEVEASPTVVASEFGAGTDPGGGDQSVPQGDTVQSSDSSVVFVGENVVP